MSMTEYRTASVNSEADIVSEIIGFADDNGWAVFPSDGVIGDNATCFVRIWDDAGGIRITGGRSYPGTGTSLGDQSPRYSRIYKGTIFGNQWIPQGTLHLFAHESPKAIFAILNYSSDCYQWLAFGNIEKYASFNGGEFYFGSVEQTADLQGVQNIGRTRDPGMLLAPYISANRNSPSRLYMDFGDPGAPAGNTAIWANTQDFDSPASTYPVSHTWGNRVDNGLLVNVIANSVNEWNSQTVLVPPFAFVSRPDGLFSVAGRAPGFRFMKSDNFNREEEFTVGEKSYKVFPWFQRTTDGTGTQTWATAMELPETP